MNFRSILNLVLAAIPSALLLSACSQAQQRPLAEEILFQTAAPDTWGDEFVLVEGTGVPATIEGGRGHIL